MLVDIPEYRLKPKIVTAIQIEDVGKTEWVETDTMWIYRGLAFTTNLPIKEGDYIVMHGGHTEYLEKSEFEAMFELNTMDNWQEEQIGTDNNGFEWALSLLRSGMKVTRGGVVVEPGYQDGLLTLFEQIKDFNGVTLVCEKWLPTLEDLQANDWEAIV